jgi:hypothetical protein
MESTMDFETYWDESEFEFFSTLEDNDKLMYIYDLCIGEHLGGMEFGTDKDMLNLMNDALKSMGDTEDDDELEPDFDSRDSIRNPVTVQISTDKLIITGPTLDVILKVARDMEMNGMMLSDREIEFTKFEPWDVILSYNLIGQGPAISLN